MESLLQLEHFLTAEEMMIRDLVRHYIEQTVLDRIAELYEVGSFPTEWIADLARLGLFGITLPEIYGGGGASPMAYGLVCEALEWGDSGLRSFVSVQNSLCMFPIFEYGTEEQKKEYLPRMSRGECIGCFGLTEPDSGSDPASMKTFAKKVPGGWQLNGAKLWITNASIAEIGIVWAKTEVWIRGFIVDLQSKGCSRHNIEHKLSLRASSTGGLNFNDLFVPERGYLPGTEVGLRAALQCLTQARYGIAWGTVGAAQFCYEKALEYAQTRIQFGRPIAATQLVQNQLVEMFCEIEKARLLNIQMARLKATGALSALCVSMAKRNGCRLGLHVARQARNILGANGISLEYHVIRHMNNLESVFTYEGTDHIHTLTLGRYLTGINAF